MKKKILAGLLTTTFTVAALTGCGSAANTNTAATEEATGEAEETVEAASGELTTIKVAASATPHAEILEFAAPLLEAKGYEVWLNIIIEYCYIKLVALCLKKWCSKL